MEKRKPHFDLDAFKAVCGEPKRLRMTLSASLSAAALGFDPEGVADIVRAMQRTHFFKAMTSYSDHRRWQDVYHVPWGRLTLYLKFTDDVVTQFVVLSFKER